MFQVAPKKLHNQRVRQKPGLAKRRNQKKNQQQENQQHMRKRLSINSSAKQFVLNFLHIHFNFFRLLREFVVE